MKIAKKEEKKEEKKYEEKEMNGVSLRVYESGFASLSVKVCDGEIIINGRIAENKKGEPFFSFPSRKGKDGEYRNECYAMGDDLRKTISDLVNTLID